MQKQRLQNILNSYTTVSGVFEIIYHCIWRGLSHILLYLELTKAYVIVYGMY